MPSFADIKDIAPWVAISFSIAALTLSILNYRRDRADVQATSTFSLDWEGIHACLLVKIVNAGRRPIIFTTWSGAETRQRRFRGREVLSCSGTYFDAKVGVTLNEGQTHTFKLEADDLVDILPNDEAVVIDEIWIDDTLGRRHKVKDVRENIALLWAWKKNPSSVRKAG
jgi:hypothetical protein